MLEVSTEACSTDSNLYSPGEYDLSNSNNDDDEVAQSLEKSPSSKATELTLSYPVSREIDLNSATSFGVPLSGTPIPVEMLAQITSPSTVAIVNNHRFATSKAIGEKKQRKSLKFKPSNVWNHFLRLSDGNVQCVHCAKILKRKDSSTKTMWGHLRAIHFKGRDWTALQQQAARDRNRNPTDPLEAVNLDEPDPATTGSTQSWLEQQLGIQSSSPKHEPASYSETDEQLDVQANDLNTCPSAATPTQPYVKRNRSLPFTSNSCVANSRTADVNMVHERSASSVDGLHAVRAALAQSQDSVEEKSLNFLSTIPHTSEVINITAGYINDEEQRSECNGKLEENGSAECSNECSSTASFLASRLKSASFANGHLSIDNHSVCSNHLSFSRALAGFSIMDGESVLLLMRVASDLDCTFSFHCRDGQPQLCFESNYSASEKLRGPEVSLVEVDNKVRVLERNNGVEVGLEVWRKTDKAQFMWAVRGKCQKVLKQ